MSPTKIEGEQPTGDVAGCIAMPADAVQSTAKTLPKTFVERPDFNPDRAHNRMAQSWNQCRGCSLWYAAPTKELNRGRRVFCSVSCCADHAKRTGKFKGDKNPRWIGGVSNDNMRYRRRAKEKWPEHERARQMVSDAVKSGRLTKLPCEHCGDPKSQGHHEDYTKPLVVIWLCRPCHDQEHARLKKEAA